MAAASAGAKIVVREKHVKDIIGGHEDCPRAKELAISFARLRWHEFESAPTEIFNNMDDDVSNLKQSSDFIIDSPTNRNDVFISYSHDELGSMQQLVFSLENSGYSVWWDRELAPGEVYSDVIKYEIEKSKAVIVVWNEKSIRSSLVYSEATLADAENKLISIRQECVDPADIPKPFNMDHCELLGDNKAIIAALKTRGVYPITKAFSAQSRLN